MCQSGYLLGECCRTTGAVVAEESSDYQIEDDWMRTDGRVGGLASIP